MSILQFLLNSAAASTPSISSVSVYTASQTITIPTGVTAAKITLIGAGGGSGGTRALNSGVCCSATGVAISGPGGGGGGLIKYLSSLTAGNTLTLTIGAAGTGGTTSGTNGGNGGSTTLASGTQTISTLTAGGGSGGVGINVFSTQGIGAAAAGGGSTGGDINISGSIGLNPLDTFNGTTGYIASVGGYSPVQGSLRAKSLLNRGATNTDQTAVGVAGLNYGGGAAGAIAVAGSNQALANGAAGAQGLAIIEWYA